MIITIQITEETSQEVTNSLIYDTFKNCINNYKKYESKLNNLSLGVPIRMGYHIIVSESGSNSNNWTSLGSELGLTSKLFYKSILDEYDWLSGRDPNKFHPKYALIANHPIYLKGKLALAYGEAISKLKIDQIEMKD